jgi:hypothetical protein
MPERGWQVKGGTWSVHEKGDTLDFPATVMYVASSRSTLKNNEHRGVEQETSKLCLQTRMNDIDAIGVWWQQ